MEKTTKGKLCKVEFLQEKGELLITLLKKTLREVWKICVQHINILLTNIQIFIRKRQLLRINKEFLYTK